MFDGGRIGGNIVEGATDLQNRLVLLSRQALDPLRVATEETVHALRGLGLLRPEEWAALSRKAGETGARARYKIDETYGSAYRAKFPEPERLEEALIEETVAHMLADHAAGVRFDPPTDGLLAKIALFFERLRNALRGEGFVTEADAVVARIESGEVGKRTPPGAPEGAPPSPRIKSGAGSEGEGFEMLAMRRLDPSRLGDPDFMLSLRPMADGELRGLGLEGPDLAARQEAEGAHRTYQALKQLEVTDRLERDVFGHTNARGEPDPAAALIAIVEHHGRFAFSSVKGRADTILGMAVMMRHMTLMARPRLRNGISLNFAPPNHRASGVLRRA